MPRLLPCFLICLLAWMTASGLRAHDPFVAEIKAEAEAATLTFHLTFSRSVAAHLAGLTDGPRLFYAPDRFQTDLAVFSSAAATLVLIENDGAPLASLGPGSAALVDDGDDVVFTLRFPRPISDAQVRFSNRWLTRLPPAENYVATFVLKEDDKLLAGPLLISGEMPTIDLALPASPEIKAAFSSREPEAAQPAGFTPSAEPARVSAGAFFKLGVEHILTGYDHLLYLAALILGCTGLRAIIGIVTAFTVSHSITLALATLGVVTPPSALVEQVIAGSIVFVALENLWLRGRDPKLRQVVAFAFGLVHGFGFAGLLADLGVGAEHGAVVVPLLSFNLGVEAGQLLVIAIVLPLLLQARRRPRFITVLQPAASVAVAALGLIWLVDRL